MAIKLANELIDAANETGSSIKKEKKYIVWQRLIKHLHIIDSKSLD